MAISLHLQSQKRSISLTWLLSSHLLLSLLRPPSYTFKDPYWAHPEYLGSSPCFKVTWLATLIPLCHVAKHIHRFWDINRTWTSLGGNLCQIPSFSLYLMCLYPIHSLCLSFKVHPPVKRNLTLHFTPPPLQKHAPPPPQKNTKILLRQVTVFILYHIF